MGRPLDEDGQIQGKLLVVVVVAQLSGYGEPVEPVECCSFGVPRGRRPIEEGNAVLLVLDPISQHVNNAPAVYLALDPRQKLAPCRRILVEREGACRFGLGRG